MKKFLTALCATAVLAGCLLMLPIQTEAAKTTTSASTSAKVKITKQPASAQVYVGSKIKVKVKATGSGLKYRWYYKDKGMKSYKRDKSITSSTYNRKMTTAMDGRKIYCKITDKYGNTVKSKTVTLTAMNKATITKQPSSVKVYAGSKSTVKVKATGDGLIYKWYYKDKGMKSYKVDKNITGATYNRKMTKDMDGRKVYCKITDEYGNTVKSKAVKITVRNKATVTKQPASTAVYSGKYATVKVGATGDGITYTWYYKNAGAKSFKKASVTGSTYKVKMNSDRDGRQLYCVVKDKYGNKVKTETVTISMMNKATITEQPASAGFYAGSQITVKVKATGDGITYKWYYKDTSSTYFRADSGVTGAAYNRTMTQAMNGRQLYCKITDQYGNTVTTKTVTVTVKNKATITSQPVSASIYSGEYATVKVGATGDGLTYTWYYKNAGSSSFKKTTAFTGNTYQVEMTKERDGRQLYCKVTDKYGNSVKSNTVTLEVKIRAAITKQPSSAEVFVGDKIPVTVSAVGDGITYKWYYRASSASSWKLDTSVTGNAYNPTMTAAMNGRQVYCKVTDQYGNYVSTATVTISAKSKAGITTQPVSAEVYEGAAIPVTVTAVGDGISYRWYYKDTEMSSFAEDTGITGKAYNRKATAEMEGRQLYCKVTDQYGNTVQSDTVTVDVKVKAAILTQPQNVETELGQTAQVSFEAKGDGLTYQWYYKDADSSGKLFDKSDVTDSVYSCEVTIPVVGRRVYCVITDSYGNSVSTDVVTITAPIPATILKQPLAVQYEYEKPVEITFTAAGDGLTYQWYHRGANTTDFEEVTGYTSITYRISSLTKGIEGRQIFCRITDQYGNSVDTDAVVITTKPYYTTYYGPYEDIFCVELVGKEFATTDLVDWTFEKVGTDTSGDYGFAEEVVVQSQASIRGLDYGDGTYLTKYVGVTETDKDDLIQYLQMEGFSIYATSTLNDDVTTTNLTYENYCCTVTFCEHTGELYVTASKTMAYSPNLLAENTSTQSERIDGATTTLTMIPTDGDCYIIQLKNGNFIIFDGNNADTLADVLDYLEAHTPEGQIPVVEAWFITHGHYDHCSWIYAFYANEHKELDAANRVRVEGVYFNQTAEQNWKQTVFSWRSDTATTGYRTRGGNPWVSRVRPGVAAMKTSSGETTKMYRPQAGQIYYFCGLQIEIPYAQEMIPFADYQMDLNASTTWHLVRSEEGNTFLDAADTENVNMEHVMNLYSREYDVYNGNLDIMSIFHHGHNIYKAYQDIFRAPILFLPRGYNSGWDAEATTVFRYYTTKNGTRYYDLVAKKYKRDGLGLEWYNYREDGSDNSSAYVLHTYDFATGKVSVQPWE